MKKFLAFVILILVVAAGASAFWLLRQDHALSERPAKGTPGGKEVEAESIITAKVQIAYSALEALLEKKVPPQISESGQGEVMTHPLRSFIGPGPGVPVGYRWSILLEREKISVKPDAPANRLAVSVPVKVSGWGGLRGDGARLVGLDRKNLRGNVEISYTAKPEIHQDWRFGLTIDPTHRWIQAPEVEAMGGVWVNVLGQVDPKVTEALQKAKTDAETSLDPDAVRKAVAPEWRVRHLKLGSFQGNDIVTTLTPLAAGFSGLEFAPEGARFVISLNVRSKTVLAAAPLPPDGPPLSLPALAEVPRQAGKTVLKVPIYVSYDALRSALLGSVSKNGYHSDSTPLGKATVWIEDAMIYPAENDRLAVGVRIKAKFEQRLLDVRGWVWLTARPRIDAQRQVLAFDDIEFTRALDNALVSATTVVLHDQIRKLLNSNSALEFGPRIKEIETQVRQLPQQGKLPDGLQVSVQDLKVACDEPIILTGDKVGVHARIEAAVTCELQALPVPDK